MPEYVKQSLQKFQHTLPTTPEYAPRAHVSPTYFQRVQYAEPVYTSNVPPPTERKTFLYYVLAIDNTILVALNNISLEHLSATKNTPKEVSKLLNYLKNVQTSQYIIILVT